MGEAVLTDAQIDALSATERRMLIERLQPQIELPSPETIRRIRAIRLGVLTAGPILLIPWIIYLALTLPASYQAQNWPIAWTGFDVLVVALMASTAYLGWRRRQLLALPAVATGTLMVADAWFDIVTANTDDLLISAGTALVVELPLAILLLSSAYRLTGLLAHRYQPEAVDTPLWRLAIPMR